MRRGCGIVKMRNASQPAGRVRYDRPRRAGRARNTGNGGAGRDRRRGSSRPGRRRRLGVARTGRHACRGDPRCRWPRTPQRPSARASWPVGSASRSRRSRTFAVPSPMSGCCGASGLASHWDASLPNWAAPTSWPSTWSRSSTRRARRLPTGSEETVQLAVLDGLEMTYLARHDGQQPVRLTSQIGRRLPATSTATGKAALASSIRGSSSGAWTGSRA